MADDSADDPKAQARLAEREYLQQRLAELTPEYQKATEEAGLTPQMVTPQEIERLKGELVEAMDRSGNAPLARKWRAAYEAWDSACARLDQLNEQSRRRRREANPDPVTDEEYPGWVTAREEMDAAGEDFQRVNAKVSTWLDAHGGGPKKDPAGGDSGA